MSGAAFLRIKKLTGSGIIAKAARHNKRVIQAENGAVGSIDPVRSHLNESLGGPHTADGVAQLAKDRMRSAGIGKLRRDAVMGVEIVFSLPLGHGLDDRAYFANCATWVADKYGGIDNVLSVDIHRDEAAPHCHVLMLPLLNNRMNGSKMVGNRQKFLALHADFHDKVARHYGLKKAPQRLQGATKKSAAALILKKLQNEADPVLKSVAWPLIREAIESDPAPYLLALGIEVSNPKKPLRTMAQIFTSKGKGKQYEQSTKQYEQSPIGFAVRKQDQSLCSVGFAPTTAPEAATPAPLVVPAELPEPQEVRIKDSDLDPAQFDPETGEYFRPPTPSGKAQRMAADKWVAKVLK